MRLFEKINVWACISSKKSKFAKRDFVGKIAEIRGSAVRIKLDNGRNIVIANTRVFDDFCIGRKRKLSQTESTTAQQKRIWEEREFTDAEVRVARQHSNSFATFSGSNRAFDLLSESSLHCSIAVRWIQDLALLAIRVTRPPGLSCKSRGGDLWRVALSGASSDAQRSEPRVRCAPADIGYV